MPLSPQKASTLEQLRERIRKLQAAPRPELSVLRTQVEPFDGLFAQGGVPLGCALELCGEAASGRTSLALRAVAAAGAQGQLTAWVDGPAELYPPAAQGLGVALSRLLIVRPEKPSQLAWAATQLCRSGAFLCVVLDLTRTKVLLGPAEAKKLSDAAFRSGTLLWLLTEPHAPAGGLLRLSTKVEGARGLRVEVLRHRQGGSGRSALVPWSELLPGPKPPRLSLLRP